MKHVCILACSLLLTGCNAMSGLMSEQPTATVAPAAVDAVPAQSPAPPLNDLDCRPGRAGSSTISCD